MQLVRDVPVEINRDRLKPSPDSVALSSLFERLEFSAMLGRWKPFISRFGGSGVASDGASPSSSRAPASAPHVSVTATTASAVTGTVAADNSLQCVVTSTTSPTEAVQLFKDGSSRIGVAAAWSGEAGRSDIVALVLSCRPADGRANAPVPCSAIDASQLADTSLRKTLMQASNLVANDARNLLRGLLTLGIDVSKLAFDTAIAAYLVEAESGSYDAASIARRWLKRRIIRSSNTPEGELNFDANPHEAALEEAALEATVAALAEPILRTALEEAKLAELYDGTELPLVRVLAKMEHVGIGVDRARLTALEHELRTKSNALVVSLHKEAGREFNVNSPKQLAEILFVEKGLTGGKKTKTKKPSTDAQTLEKLRDEWPEFIGPLLEYRETEKLRSTYAEGLLAAIADDGRIHASFNQTVARTGRLSSDQPNLHNIPVRSDAGRVFREAFVPKAGCEFLVADYNQIELRCIAHLAQDPGLLRAFNEGLDIHRATAAQVFGVKLADVTSEQRSKAKMVSYGLAYGMEAYGLSQRLAIDVGEAKEILDAYFSAFPKVRKYMDETVENARKHGHTTTLFGRRRQIEGFGGNRNVDAAAARMAMNAGIQGLAADIFKIALVAIDRKLEAGGFASRIVLQVHDEVILEVPAEERGTVGPLALEAMQGAARLDVPLVVNASWGRSWAGAKVA
jgi:DNA polymerase-1